MGNGAGTATGMEGIQASTARLNVLFLEDAALENGANGAIGDVVDVLQRRYEIRLERLAVTKHIEAQLAAVKAQDAADISELQQAMTPPGASLQDRSFQDMSTVEEIAGVLTISSAAADALITQARQLCSLPLTMAALTTGTITWQHAKIIADETEGLGPAGANALVAHFFDPDAPHPARGAAPGELVPARFRAKVRTWRERHHPDTLEKRHTKCATDRRMEYSPDRDGMAWLSLYLPGDTANAIWNRTTALARGLQNPHEPRTLTQLRPDIAAGLLLSPTPVLTQTAPECPTANPGTTANAGTEQSSGTPIGTASLAIDDQPCTAPTSTSTTSAGTGTGASDEVAAGAGAGAPDLGQVPAPKVDVLVTVPVFALLGLTDEPAHLDGHGPIPASMARKLIINGAASFHRVLVDPRDGAPLEIGRTSYRLTKAMKKALQLRDGKCTFPGCNNPSPDNETDHLKAWQHGGTTGISNLAQLCPKHHHLKHNSGWTPTPATQNEPPGWTSPTGRHYKAEHHDWEPPHWPPSPLPTTETPGFVEAEPPPWLLDNQPPIQEPTDDTLEDPADFPPDHPIWDDFFATPPKPPKDPLKEWARDLVHF